MALFKQYNFLSKQVADDSQITLDEVASKNMQLSTVKVESE